MGKDGQVERIFLAGRYGELARSALGGEPFSPKTAPWMIGALSMCGRAAEAEALLRSQLDAIDEQTKVGCRYFLGIGYLLAGREGRARRYLAKNAALRRNVESPFGRFLVHQGLAFHRFYTGRLRVGLIAAVRASAWAEECGHPFALLSACETRGHLLFLSGEQAAGLSLLETAQALARTHGNHGLARALSVSIANYRARLAPDKPKTSKALEILRQDLPEEDTFGRASLTLELARTLLRRGRLPEARRELQVVRDRLEAFPNRRFRIALALRYAEYALACGDAAETLMHLDHADLCIEPEVDALLCGESLALRVTALERLGHEEQAAFVRAKLVSLARRTGDEASRTFLSGKTSPGRTPELNHRQLRILKYLQEHEYIDTAACRQLFLVSEITACRDLAGLHRLELVRRVGKARATRYTLRGAKRGEGFSQTAGPLP